MKEKFMGTKELSAYLGCTKWTVYRYNDLGLPSYKVNGQFCYRQTEVDDWIKNFRIRRILPVLETTVVQTVFHNKGERKDDMAKNAKSKNRLSFPYGQAYQRKPGGNWTLDYKDKHGKRIQVVSKFAVTPGQAKQALEKAVYEEHFGKPELPRIIFGEFAVMYLEDYAETNKKSWRTDEGYIKHMKEFFKGRYIDTITQQDIERYKLARKKHRAQKYKKGDVTLSTVNKSLQILSKMFSCAISWGYLDSNPCKGVKKYSEASYRRTRVLSEDEEAKLLKAVVPEYLKQMIQLFLNTGLRRKELFQLEWKDVDFKQRQLYIRETKTQQSRYVPMNEMVEDILKVLYRNRSNDLVFVNPKTSKKFVDIRRAFYGACRRAEIKDLLLLDLRRSFATRILLAGCDIITVQQLLGHTSVTTTQIYTQTNQDQKTRAVSLLDPKRETICDVAVTFKEEKLVNYGFSIN